MKAPTIMLLLFALYVYDTDRHSPAYLVISTIVNVAVAWNRCRHIELLLAMFGSLVVATCASIVHRELLPRHKQLTYDYVTVQIYYFLWSLGYTLHRILD